MKFGRRLIAEAARKYHTAYFDYKACKKAIKLDVQEKDVQGTHFSACLLHELQKVSAYFSSKASQLEANYQDCLLHSKTAELAELRSEVQELIKFVALNYLAVVKAIKKRNRHLKENFGSAANTSLHALDLLLGEVFFTSPRLASLATQAEVLARDLQGACGSPTCSSTTSCGAAQQQQQQEQHQQQQQQLLEEYACPVCLDTLHNPVVLTCAHRFCWGCLVAHCTSCRDTALPPGGAKAEGTAPAHSYRMLEDIACTSEPESPTFYPCPVCRKPQLLDIDTLQVDTYLEQFVTNLQSIATVKVSDGSTTTTTTTAMAVSTATQQQSTESTAVSGHLVIRQSGAAAVKREPWGVIPPQSAKYKGKLCVLLDLDGTLVSSFTPKRAPRLPPYVRTHVVGLGSKLNPQGVFVVERPGLTSFLEQLAAFAEVIVFTAGLEDYASPIIDAIDPQGRFFVGRIYREGTLRTEHYQCVKDMARLNRSLQRTVLVDDTPLAFLHQPDNGVPVLGFRGDPDDRLLLEAVLPLLQTLADEPDVTSVLHRRFDMGGWFRRHGFPVDLITRRALADAAAERERHSRAREQDAKDQPSSGLGGATPGSPGPAPVLRPACLLPTPQPLTTQPSKEFLVLADFDQTLTDWDAGERVCEQLAPELLPMLVGVECPASCVPVTNSVLSEMQRRGVSRDKLLATLHDLGAQEMPQATTNMLQALRNAKIDVKVLSDCNSVYILHILAGARLAGLVQDIITNPASFERTETTANQPATTSPAGSAAAPASAAKGHKLMVSPWHGTAGRDTHQCSMCPSNMCKGREVRALKQAGTYRRIVYAGDGANDVCAALCLGPGDVVLAREGRPLAEYLLRAARQEPGVLRPQAQYQLWHTHEDLQALVQALVGVPTGRST